MRNMTGEIFDTYETKGECFCPVCGSSNIEYDDTNYDITATLYIDYRCKDCGSEFSHRYEWTGGYVFKDNRFNGEE